MEGNSWERLIRTERNGQSAIVGIEGENHDSSLSSDLSSDDGGIGAREERVRCVLSELRHLASIRSQCETALRQLPPRSNERERMRNRVLHIDSTLNLVMVVVEALDDCEPGLGSIFQLSYIDNLTCERIGALLGVSKRTVIRRRNHIVALIASDDDLYSIIVGDAA